MPPGKPAPKRRKPSFISRLEELCSSDDLSIDELRRMTEDLTFASSNHNGISVDSSGDRQYHKSTFLHRLCLNKNVTYEIVELLLTLFPTAFGFNMAVPSEYVISAYPLHLACYNEDCPNEVIQLLLEKSGDYQLSHISDMDFDYGDSDIIVDEDDYYGGVPLHFYLSRTSNVSLDIVKQLANPDISLTACDETLCIPIHILMHNKCVGDMFDVVEYLVELNPSSLLESDLYGQVPLHVACQNKHITARLVQTLMQPCPESTHQPNNFNELPMHILCKGHRDIDDEVAIDILRILLDANPNSVRTQTHDDNEDDGDLPLHIAVTNKSQAFCELLVDVYPESVRRKNRYPASLPFHKACEGGRRDTIEYLLSLYPESVHIRNNRGYLPIHEAVICPGENTPEIIEFLLHHDPECLSKPVVSTNEMDNEHLYQGNAALPLHVACNSFGNSDSTKQLFDLYPDAILIRNGQGQLPIDILRQRLDELPVDSETGRLYNEELGEKIRKMMAFISNQMIFARQAQDRNVMRTPVHGMLPLHKAIRENAPLGTVKLLVKGNPEAIDIPDNINGMLPLDIASMVGTVGAVKYLAELSPDRLNACDMNKNYPLHHACQGVNCEVISYLLETPMSSVSERNVDGMLPIHLFCEFASCAPDEDEDDDTKYTDTIWRLLMAYPETVLNW